MLRSLLAMALVMVSELAAAEVPSDHIPNSVSLPASYPASWVFVYAMPQKEFFLLGSYTVVDVSTDATAYKGQFSGAFFPALIAPDAASNMYVAESYLERISRGRRNDVLTITDKSNLNPVTEIPLPGSKRNGLDGNILDITRDGRFILILNFTPASSVSVVDAGKRKLVGEVPIPGCTSIYPTGPHGFSSLCQDGSLVTLTLGDKGQVLHESRHAGFNDIDNDFLYLEPASTGGVTYFVSSKGNVYPVALTHDEPKFLPTWPLMTAEQFADGWRTAMGVTVAADDSERLYVRLYRETGYEKQARANTEVWVFDVKERKRLGRIPLKNGGTSIDVTPGKQSLLVVAAESDPGQGAGLDVYDTGTGGWVRTIGGWLPGVGLNLVHARR